MGRLVAKVPHRIRREASYALNWVLSGRFGLPAPTIEGHAAGEIVLSLSHAEGRLRSPCVGGWGPATERGAFRARPGAPVSPVQEGGMEPTLVFGRPGQTSDAEGISLSFDPWGVIFWCLTRVEELETETRDRHGRFAASQSYLVHHGLLERPIADEYVELLWSCVHRLWPGLTRKADRPAIYITCDVDTPYSRALRGVAHLARAIGGDLCRRRSIAAAGQSLRNAWRVARRGDYSLDPNNTFGWMMDRCEERGHRAAFYFIAANHPVDPRYDLTEPFVRGLLRQVAERGHEIGMHGSYVSHRSVEAMTSEFENLRSVCRELGIQPAAWGNRQHYLRWEMSATPDALADAGLAYDTTLSFADRAGFRCGTCHEFPLWSWQRRIALDLRERPLIVMEASVFGSTYMGLDAGAGLDLILSLARTCRRYGGNFVLLWHNSSFQSPADREIYAAVLNC